jgi:ribosomal protein L17
MALVEAAKIFRKHLNPFVQYFELGEERVSEEAAAAAGVDEDLIRKLNMPISELELSVRASNCLESARIESVAQLVTQTDNDLLKLRSFGRTSLREVKRKLQDLGLDLGMTVELPEGRCDVPDAPPAARGLWEDSVRGPVYTPSLHFARRCAGCNAGGPAETGSVSTFIAARGAAFRNPTQAGSEFESCVTARPVSSSGVPPLTVQATLRNLAAGLFEHGQVVTTLPKAKAVQPFVEKIVTLAKRGDLHARRMVIAKLGRDRQGFDWLYLPRAPATPRRKHVGNLRERASSFFPVPESSKVERNRYGELRKAPKLVKHIFENVAPRFKDRAGGYTRIIKLGRHRIGDASRAGLLIQFVGAEEGPEIGGKPSTRRRTADKRTAFAAKVRKAEAKA